MQWPTTVVGCDAMLADYSRMLKVLSNRRSKEIAWTKIDRILEIRYELTDGHKLTKKEFVENALAKALTEC